MKEGIPTARALKDHPTLIVEFAALQKQQWEALDRAIYLGMTAREAQEYERRARRIIQRQRVLGMNLNIPESRGHTSEST